MGKLIEGFWSCDKCGRKKIRSRYDSCPGCGSRRNITTKYEMLDKTNYVPDEIANTIDKRPYWLCPYCNNLNRASANSCESCGASKETSTKDYFENKKEREERECKIKELDEYYNNPIKDEYMYDNMDDEMDSNYPSAQTTITSDIKRRKSKHSYSLKDIFGTKIFKIGAGIIFTILVSIMLFFIFKPRVENIKIIDFSWKSSISVEEYKTVEENDWSLPAGARLLYTRDEISHYDKVVDHYETKTKLVTKRVIVGYKDEISYKDLGNGYFEEEKNVVPIYDNVTEQEEYQEAVYRYDPVYRKKYYYEIDKWVYKETLIENGNDKEPYYPELNLLSNERESSRTQEYFVIGDDKKGESITLSVSYDDWVKLNKGQTVKFKIYFDNSAKIVE